MTTKYNNVPQRAAGWSESWYVEQPFSDSMHNIFVRLMQKRALILPASGAIVGCRYQIIDGDKVGQATSRNVYFSGVTGNENDMPQMSLKYLVNATAGNNKKILILRGIPDSQIINGEFSPTSQYRSAVAALLAEIATGWCFRGQVLDAETVPMLGIDLNGNYSLLKASAFTENSIVKILRAVNSSGRQKGAVCRITTLTSGFAGVVSGWTHGACKNGKMRQHSITYPSARDISADVLYGELIVRKAGRPFHQFHGRRSSKSPG
jgi:hypothetical protein